MTEVQKGSTTDLAERVADRANGAPVKAGKTLADYIREQGEGIAMAVPKGALDPERFMRVVLTEVKKNPRLQECTRESFLGAMMQTAQLGLEPGGTLGQAYLIPYQNSFKDAQGNWSKRMECQLQIGYKGYVELGGRKGMLIQAREVKENDEFAFELGTDDFVHHTWKLGVNRGDVIGFWGKVTMPDGKKRYHVMDVDEIRDRAKRAKVDLTKGVWVTDFDAMARKTVIRAMVPQIPMSPELQIALQADNAVIEQGRDKELKYEYREAIDVAPVQSSAAEQVAEALNLMTQADRLACSKHLREHFGGAEDLTDAMLPAVLNTIRSWPNVANREAIDLVTGEITGGDSAESATSGPQKAPGSPQDAGSPGSATEAPPEDTGKMVVPGPGLLEDTIRQVCEGQWPKDTVDFHLGRLGLDKTGELKSKRLRLAQALAKGREEGDETTLALF